jgi:hypothetical protein
VLLLRAPLNGTPGWWVAPPDEDPSATVRGALAAVLGGRFDESTAVVHSTSWRFDPRHRTLVLTYLAILPGTLTPADLPDGVAAEPVDSPGDVLDHGLRHFALLRISGPAIADALDERWHTFLSSRHPLPAGLLHHYEELREALGGTGARRLNPA